MRSYRTRAGRSVVRTTLFAGAVIAAILFAGDGPTFAAASGDAACAAAPARSSCPTPQRPRPALYGTQMYDANGRPLTRIPAQTRGSAAATTASPQVVRGPDFFITYQGVTLHMNLPDQWLDVGNSWTYWHARLALQTDGNLVVYDNRNNAPKWATNTVGAGASQLLFQSDGNLVLYTPGYGRAVWASNTPSVCGDRGEAPLLALQSDSNVVLYCGLFTDSGFFLDADVVWATNTVF